MMTKTSLIIALSACLSVALAVVIPMLQDRLDAVGPLNGLSPALKRTFGDDESFSPLPEPGPGDWLSSHREKGQGYRAFLKSKPNKPGAQGRKFIYLQPLGDFPKDAVSLETLQQYMEAYFHPMPVKLAASLPVKPGKKMRARRGGMGLQWHCKDLLDGLQRRLPADAHVMMGITMTDLYPEESWNFVFGMARIKKRVGVFSFARYGVDPKTALLRAMKVISHETGHAFGIKHCIHYHCLMNGSNSLEETDRAPLHFCPACLRKIHWGLKFDPVVRYQKIAEFLKGEGMAEEEKWYRSRISRIR